MYRYFYINCSKFGSRQIKSLEFYFLPLFLLRKMISVFQCIYYVCYQMEACDLENINIFSISIYIITFLVFTKFSSRCRTLLQLIFCNYNTVQVLVIRLITIQYWCFHLNESIVYMNDFLHNVNITCSPSNELNKYWARP